MRKQNNFTRRTGTAVFALMIGFPAALQAAGEHEKSYGHAGTPDEVDRTIQVQAQGMRFSHERIPVKPGQTVRFVVTNTGETQHEFTVGPPSVQKSHRAEMREMMGSAHGENGHNGGGHQGGDHQGGGHNGGDEHHGGEAGSSGHASASSGHGHANSVMVQPGETKELIWHFAQVDNVRFGCNVPGHYQAGMHGPFVAGE